MSTPPRGSYHGRTDPDAPQTISGALPAPVDQDADWGQVLRLVPLDLEASARASGALQRRRQVRSAADLLRLVLAYVLTSSSLRLLAGWALLLGLGELSDVAVLKRLGHCQAWLQLILTGCLGAPDPQVVRSGLHLWLIDATTASRPGATGTDFRVHLGFDLAEWRVVEVELTDAHGGETLARHRVGAETVAVVDRGYAHRVGLGQTIEAHGQVVVRTNAQNLSLQDPSGQRLDLVTDLRRIPLDQAVSEQAVVVATPEGNFPLRLIVGRLSQAAAERARRRVYEQAKKKGHTPSEASLVAADFVLVVTNLDAEQWSAEQVLCLYRLRWQVELVFKRLKGVLELDEIRARHSALAQAYLLGKLVAAVLVERWSGQQCPPACTEWFETLERPVSPWRWLRWWHAALRAAVHGSIGSQQAIGCLPQLRRYLCDTPRRRGQQAAQARAFARLLAAFGQPTAPTALPVPSLS